jgi:hypothetical protein
VWPSPVVIPTEARIPVVGPRLCGGDTWRTRRSIQSDPLPRERYGLKNLSGGLPLAEAPSQLLLSHQLLNLLRTARQALSEDLRTILSN